MPYLADAVPGWFQATVTLYDSQGKEVAYDDDYRFHPDPVLFYKIPEDGQYMLEIKDAIYRGREDFVYRITIGELPFVTSIFPLGGPAGPKTTVQLTGWNLRQTADVGYHGQDVGRHRSSVRTGNRAPTACHSPSTRCPECRKEPNDRNKPPAGHASGDRQRADRPAGRLGRVSFEGHAGDQVIGGGYARRLDSPLDSVLELTDAAGKRLAFNDDHEDKADALNTHHADSLVNFTLPADGTYFVRLGDAQKQGGPEYAYRVPVSPPPA